MNKARMLEYRPVFMSTDREQALAYYGKLGFVYNSVTGFLERDELKFAIHQIANAQAPVTITKRTTRSASSPSRFSPIGPAKSRQPFPGLEYAVVTHKGSLRALYDTYGYFHSKWRALAGYNYADRYDIQLYDARFRGPHDPNSELDIYFPVKRSLCHMPTSEATSQPS